MSLPTYNGQVIERDERFDELLDECHPEYKMGELTFSPSDILYYCDPIAYYIGVSEMEDMEDYQE
jgi:hypothetical protein